MLQSLRDPFHLEVNKLIQTIINNNNNNNNYRPKTCQTLIPLWIDRLCFDMRCHKTTLRSLNWSQLLAQPILQPKKCIKYHTLTRNYEFVLLAFKNPGQGFLKLFGCRSRNFSWPSLGSKLYGSVLRWRLLLLFDAVTKSCLMFLT